MRVLVVCCTLILVSGCEQSTVINDQNAVTSKNIEISNDENSLQKVPENPENSQPVIYQAIEWTELIPQTDLDALLNPPEYIMNVADGSIEDQIVRNKASVMNTELSGKNDYEKALISTDVIEAMDGKYIEIPGFIVPVAFDDEQVVTSFFLVPYFGACLHMPPPPPNQIIYIEIEHGFLLAEFYDPVVVSGQLSVELFEDQIAVSAYTMTMDKIRMYYENE